MTVATQTQSATRNSPAIDDPKQQKNYSKTSEAETLRPNYVRERVLGSTIVAGDYAYPLRTYTTQAVPNDPVATQWWSESARLPQMWDTNTGTPHTVLAIIDTGVALDHEEFIGRWAINAGEQGSVGTELPSRKNCSDQGLPLDQSCNRIDDDFDGIVDNESGVTAEENSSSLNCSDQGKSLDKSCNRIDDDGNGLVDDWRGWDFANYDNVPQAGQVAPNGKGVKHGTYVTGAAAASGNNGVGIAGVNWQTKILPLQGLTDSGSGNSVMIARAVRYAIERKADVISMSLGSIYPDSYIRAAVQEAINAGIIVVAASGNDGCECMSYPANYPEVLSVGALDQTNARASFSSYGENLDVMAPGVNLYTTSWTPTNNTSHYAGGVAGTSLATPLVSGMVTSLLGTYPALSPAQIIALLNESANSLGITTQHSPQLGFGAIDGYAAETRMRSILQPALRYRYLARDDHERYECETGQHPGARIYRLKRHNDEFYTSDDMKMYAASRADYTPTLFGFSCTELGIDAPQEVRVLNLAREFSNRFTKEP